MNILEKIKNWFNTKNNNLKTGALKYFNRRKGFGFIASQDTDKDVFVHFTEMKEQIRIGDEVQFEVDETPKGLRAKNVELVQSS